MGTSIIDTKSQNIKKNKKKGVEIQFIYDAVIAKRWKL